MEQETGNRRQETGNGWRRRTTLALIASLASANSGCDPASFDGYCLGADGGCTEAGAGQTGGWGGYAGYGGESGWGGSGGWGGSAGFGGLAGSGGESGWGGSAGYSGGSGQCPGSCSATCQDCDGDSYCETMTSNHPYHCGHCNRACSECAQGLCTAQVLVSETTGYGDKELAVGGGYVYYATGAWVPATWAQFTIKRIAVNGSGIPELVAVNVPSRNGAISLTANDTAVYWASTDVGVVMASHSAPSSTTTLSPPGTQPKVNGPIHVAVNSTSHTCVVKIEGPGSMTLQGKGGSVGIPTAMSPPHVLALAADASGACYVALMDGPAELKVLGLGGQWTSVTEGWISALAFAPGMDLPYYFIRSEQGVPTLFAMTGGGPVSLDKASGLPLAAYADRVYYSYEPQVLSATQTPEARDRLPAPPSWWV